MYFIAPTPGAYQLKHSTSILAKPIRSDVVSGVATLLILMHFLNVPAGTVTTSLTFSMVDLITIGEPSSKSGVLTLLSHVIPTLTGYFIK